MTICEISHVWELSPQLLVPFWDVIGPSGYKPVPFTQSTMVGPRGVELANPPPSPSALLSVCHCDVTSGNKLCWSQHNLLGCSFFPAVNCELK